MAIRQTSSGSWQWDLKLIGWTGRQRATFKTQAEAEAHEHQTKADHALGRPYKAPTHTNSVAARAQTIGELVEHCWKVQWSEQKSAKPDPDRPWQVHPQYRNAGLFADWVGPKLPASEALTYAKVCEYALYRRDVVGSSPQTIKHHTGAISVLLDAAVASGLVPGRFKMPKQPPGASLARRDYTVKEEEEILNVCLRLGEEDYHDLFVVLAETGIRPPKEIKKLPWADIAATRITVHASIAKTGVTRKLPCSKRAREALDRVRARHPGSKGPFTWLVDHNLHTFWTRLRRLVTWLDEHTVPYSFRHTACTRWANDRNLAIRGITVAQIAHWCGHTIKQHQSYVHPVEQADDYASLVENMAEARARAGGKVLPFAA